MLDWKCLLRRYTWSAVVGQAWVYLGSGFGGGHVPYGETAWWRGKKRVSSAYSNLICPKSTLFALPKTFTSLQKQANLD